jgi:carbamoyltransferase
MKVLGISCFYHDSAAALVIDGQVISAVQEERFTRKKHDSRFPKNSIKYILENSKLKLGTIDAIVFYEKPLLKFERLIETYLTYAPAGFKSFMAAMPIWLREKIFQKTILAEHLKEFDLETNLSKKIFFSDHHLSHAASAFFPSPFKEAVVLTLDGVGEWTTSSYGVGNGHELSIHKEIHFPHSLGLLYSAFTYHAGFKVNSGEYKLMGLAPYGSPKYVDKIRQHLIHIKDDGSYSLDMKYFDYCTGFTMTNEKFDSLFGIPARSPDQELKQIHLDMAASIQQITEEVLIKMTRYLRKEYGLPNLCLAGGVALNCVANGKILKEKIFENIWIQPAAGDAGGALGAALAFSHAKGSIHRPLTDSMSGAFLGPSFSPSEVENQLKDLGAVFHKKSKKEVVSKTAKLLAEGNAVGWFQGRMEYGPRALGHRSIIADARSPKMQSQLNLKVKFRESFRPFAPAILRERLSEWFQMDVDSPYMLLVADIVESKKIPMTSEQQQLFGIDKLNVPRSDIPAVTHVDYSARVQSVDPVRNPEFYDLIKAFEIETGCPVLVNTSFNVRGEPIVCTPADAFRCFMRTALDVLVIEDFILFKSEQKPVNKDDIDEVFELD